MPPAKVHVGPLTPSRCSRPVIKCVYAVSVGIAPREESATCYECSWQWRLQRNRPVRRNRRADSAWHPWESSQSGGYRSMTLPGRRRNAMCGPRQIVWPTLTPCTHNARTHALGWWSSNLRAKRVRIDRSAGQGRACQVTVNRLAARRTKNLSLCPKSFLRGGGEGTGGVVHTYGLGGCGEAVVGQLGYGAVPKSTKALDTRHKDRYNHKEDNRQLHLLAGGCEESLLFIFS